MSLELSHRPPCCLPLNGSRAQPFLCLLQASFPPRPPGARSPPNVPTGLPLSPRFLTGSPFPQDQGRTPKLGTQPPWRTPPLLVSSPLRLCPLKPLSPRAQCTCGLCHGLFSDHTHWTRCLLCQLPLHFFPTRPLCRGLCSGLTHRIMRVPVLVMFLRSEMCLFISVAVTTPAKPLTQRKQLDP